MEKRTSPTTTPVIAFYVDVPAHQSQTLRLRLKKLLTDRKANDKLVTKSSTLGQKTRYCHHGLVANQGEDQQNLTDAITSLTNGIDDSSLGLSFIGLRNTTQEDWDQQTTRIREKHTKTVEEQKEAPPEL